MLSQLVINTDNVNTTILDECGTKMYPMYMFHYTVFSLKTALLLKRLLPLEDLPVCI